MKKNTNTYLKYIKMAIEREEDILKDCRYDDVRKGCVEEINKLKIELADKILGLDDEKLEKVGEVLPEMRKYYMYSRWEMCPGGEDVCEIGIASADDMMNDGMNWVGGGESVDFVVCDTLRSAIMYSHYIANKIKFNNLSDEEMKEANQIVEELMNDTKYLAGFGLRLEGTVVSVYNQKTKKVVECVFKDEENEGKIKTGDVVNFKKDHDTVIASGIVVNVEQQKLNKGVGHWYLFQDDGGFYINGYGIDNEEAKEDFDEEVVPFI